jgi:hypothetical protein
VYEVFAAWGILISSRESADQNNQLPQFRCSEGSDQQDDRNRDPVPSDQEKNGAQRSLRSSVQIPSVDYRRSSRVGGYAMNERSGDQDQGSQGNENPCGLLRPFIEGALHSEL